MQVQPTPIGPRSRGSRLRLVALIAAVPVILGAVVATGLAGRSASPAGPAVGAAPEPGAADAAVELAAPEETGSSASPAAPAAGLRAVIQGYSFPGSALGMPVWDVHQAMAAHRQGAANGLVAIGGWLTIGRSPVSCLQPPAQSPVTTVSHARFFCRRGAVLSGDPGGPDADQASSPLATSGLELPQWVLPGTALPISVEPPFTGDDRTMVPVVVVGRFDDDRVVYCPAGGYGCNEGFVIEHVAWMSGRWQEGRTALEPGLEPEPGSLTVLDRRALAIASLPASGPLLAEALMAPGSMSGVEPAAASAAASAKGPVWLLRVAVRSARGSLGRDVGWLVIEDRTGRVLGSSEWTTNASG